MFFPSSQLDPALQAGKLAVVQTAAEEYLPTGVLSRFQAVVRSLTGHNRQKSLILQVNHKAIALVSVARFFMLSSL